MKFNLEVLNLEITRFPNKITLIIEEKSHKKEARALIRKIKKDFPGLKEYEFDVKFESAEIKRVNNVVMLDKKKQYYNSEILTIGKLIDLEKKETGKGTLLKMKFKVPDKYATFECMKMDRKNETDLNKDKYYMISATIKRDKNTEEKDKYLKKSQKMLGIETYEMWANSVREIDYVEKNDIEEHEIKRYPLHCHTKRSIKDAMIDEKRIERAFESGKLGTFAITDHRETNAFVDYKRYFQKKDYHIIAGLEAEVFDDTKEDFNYEKDIDTCNRYHLVLINNAKDTEIPYKGKMIKVNEGIRAFNTLITNANIKYYSTPSKETKLQQEADGEFKTSRKAIMSLKEILEYKEKGILKLGSACIMGTVRQYWFKNNIEKFEKYIKLLDWVEIHPIHNEDFLIKNEFYKDINSKEDIAKKNRALYEYCKANNIDVIFADDAHVINKEDRILRSLFKKGEIAKFSSLVKKDVLEKMSEKDREKAIKDFNDDLAIERQPFLHSHGEMKKELTEQGFTEEQIKDMLETEKRISLGFPRLQDITLIPNVNLLPEFPGVDAKKEVKKIALEFALKKWAKNNDYETIDPIIKDRLKLEINALAERNYEFLYYSAMWLVQQSLKKGYIVGSRGSVGSSLLAYAMGISENNPLKPHYLCNKCKKIEWIDTITRKGVDYKDKACECGGTLEGDGLDIEFSSFLGYKHDKVPDIDLNFASVDLESDYPIQLQVMDDLKKVYTETKNLIRAGTSSYSGTDSIIANQISKIIGVKEMVENEEFEPFGIANELEGIYNNSGQHAGGLLVWDDQAHGEEEAFDFKYGFGLLLSGDGSKGLVSSIEYKPLEEFVPKLDILSKADPTYIKIMMEETGTEDFILNKMKYNDPKVARLMTDITVILPKEKAKELYYKQGTLGVPELNTVNTRKAIETCNPKNFSDLTRLEGLTHGTGVFESAKPLLESGTLLEEIPWCLRDEMFIFFVKKWKMDPAKSFKAIEYIRKGKWKIMDQELKDHLKDNLPTWVYDAVSRIEYLFPMAHSASYSAIAWRYMHFKVYYTGYFFAAVLTNQAIDLGAFPHGIAIQQECKEQVEIFKKKFIREEIEKNNTKKINDWEMMMDLYFEAYLFGFKIEMPDVGSEVKRFRFYPETKTIKAPLSIINGLGESTAMLLKEFINLGPIKSVEEFKKRTIKKEENGKVVNKKVTKKMLEGSNFEMYCKLNNIPEKVEKNASEEGRLF